VAAAAQLLGSDGVLEWWSNNVIDRSFSDPADRIFVVTRLLEHNLNDEISNAERRGGVSGELEAGQRHGGIEIFL
jgi:hypothetical protein